IALRAWAASASKDHTTPPLSIDRASACSSLGLLDRIATVSCAPANEKRERHEPRERHAGKQRERRTRWEAWEARLARGLGALGRHADLGRHVRVDEGVH